MPIRASERARYPKDWKAISARIRDRDGDRCAECTAPNGAEIGRRLDDESRWILWSAIENDPARGMYRGPVRVVLTVAHLDHAPENCADDNLKAMCQRCHLRYDHKHHQRNARETRRSRKAIGDLFP